MRISPSTLKTWMICPLMAKFQKIDRLPDQQSALATYGSAVHEALYYYNIHDGDLDGAQDVFSDLWANPEKMGRAPDFWPKYVTFIGHKAKGLDCLLAYHEGNKWETRNVVAAEHRFLVPFGRHELSGIVDILETKNGTPKILRLGDYKTGRRPNATELAYNIQFSIYWYAVTQKEFWTGNGEAFPGMPDGEELWSRFRGAKIKAYWYDLSNGRAYDVGDRDDEHFLRLYRAVDEIERAIQHEVFVPDISGASCAWCSYTDPCGVKIPEAPELERQSEQFTW